VGLSLNSGGPGRRYTVHCTVVCNSMQSSHFSAFCNAICRHCIAAVEPDLMQVSARWGKPMEMVNPRAIIEAIWPHIQAFAKSEPDCTDSCKVQALRKAVGDGYSFPTHIDKDPPCNAHQLPCSCYSFLFRREYHVIPLYVRYKGWASRIVTLPRITETIVPMLTASPEGLGRHPAVENNPVPDSPPQMG
jgi:hypothetical protein